MNEEAHKPCNTKIEYTLTEAVKLFDDLEDVRILLLELRYLDQIEIIELQLTDFGQSMFTESLTSSRKTLTRWQNCA